MKLRPYKGGASGLGHTIDYCPALEACPEAYWFRAGLSRNHSMESYPFDHLNITLNKEGAKEFVKVSFPIRYGLFSEIQTPDYLFQFNLNGEIKYIQGRSRNWPHPAEWLKRTVANDWIYYGAGDYQGFYDLMGEYYFPYLSYPSNTLLDDDPLGEEAVKAAIRSWSMVQTEMKELISGPMPQNLRDFLTRIAENDEKALGLRSQRLHHLIGGPVTVLPPDARHVDYEVIPVIVADGCLYHCGFCRVKSGGDFKPRTQKEILQQIKNLKQFYGRDLHNYNAVFLGLHDALCAGRELIEFAAEKAYQLFEFERSYLRGCHLFLFGSVDSMIDSKEKLFDSLNSLPFSTYLNIGLESADSTTLAWLGKPVAVERVREVFTRMLEINRNYEKIEVTANFVLGEDLPPSHLSSLFELIRDRIEFPCHKGALYLSPLVDGEMKEREAKKEMLRKFKKLKIESRLPTFLYLIQRL